jgi:hypothetical protein
MGTATLRSLNALVALAHIDLGEAALALADSLDEQADALKDVRRAEDHAAQLSAAYERLIKPGASIYSAAMTVLARQALGGRALLQEARTRQFSVDQQVDDQRRVVHRHQSHHEGLSKLIKESRMSHAAELERMASVEREDLFLVRRIHLKDCT